MNANEREWKRGGNFIAEAERTKRNKTRISPMFTNSKAKS